MAVIMKLMRYCTAEELSRDLSESHGIDLSADRLRELAGQGFIPSTCCDGKGPLFLASKTKQWIRKNLMVDREGAPFPTELAVFDVQTWETKGRRTPPELSLIEGHLREIPIAPLRWPPGLYFLVRVGRVVYVGQSVGVIGRLMQHLADKEFDRVFFLPVPSEHVSRLEWAFMKRLRPEYNLSQNLDKEFPYHINLDVWFADEDGMNREIVRIEQYWRKSYDEKDSRKRLRTAISNGG